MPDLRRDTLWASELLGAEVVARQQKVAEVTDLLMSPSGGMLAFQVQPYAVSEPAGVLLFDAALDYAPGRVQVLSADDVVPASRLPLFFSQLASTALIRLGMPIRSAMGETIGYLWDVRLKSLSGELVQYRVGRTPQPQDEAPSVVTSFHLCACLQGELTVQETNAAVLRDLLGQLPHSA